MTNDVKLTLTADGSQAEAAVVKVGKALDGLAAPATDAGKAVDTLTKKLSKVGDVKRLDVARDILGVDSFVKVEREIRRVEAAYKRLADSGKATAAELAQADRARAAAVEQLKAKLGEAGKAGQVSAAQTAAAFRTLPAQMTDIVTQLQGGANPLTILLQQGGQIKDSFGGFAPTFRALAGAITPVGLAVAGVAASVGFLAVAYMQAESEAAALTNANKLTGGVAGITSANIDALTASVSNLSGVTVGAARDIATAVAGSGMFNTKNAEAATRAIALYTKATGTDAPEALKLFETFTKDAAGASLTLNERVRFLTPELLKQIQGLQDHGKNAEAAAVAMKAVGDALESNRPKLTTIGQLLEDGANAWSKFWKAAKGTVVGESDSDKLASLQERIKNMRASGYKAESSPLLAGMEGEADKLTAKLNAQKAADEQRAREQDKKDERVAAQNKVAGLLAQADAQKRLNLAVEEATKAFDALEGTSAAVPAADQARVINYLRESLADRTGIATAQARIALELSTARAGAQARLDMQGKAEAALNAQRSKGLVDVEEYEDKKLAIERARLDARAKLIEQEIALEKKRPVTSAADGLTREANVASLRSQLASNRAERDNLGTNADAAKAARELEDFRKGATDFAAAYTQANEAAVSLSNQSAQALAQLITDPVERAKAEADVAVAEIERNAARIRLAVQGQADMLRGRASAALEDGKSDIAASLKAQADELDKVIQRLDTATSKASVAARQKAGAPVADDFIKGGQSVDLSAGFDKQTQSLAQFSTSFKNLLDLQIRYNQAREAAAGNAEKLAAIEKANTLQQLAGYATLVGAAKGLVKEKTGAHKLLAASEKALRAIEIAQAIRAAAVKIGLIEGETAVKVASDGTKAASESGFTLFSIAQSGARTAVKAVEALVSQLTLPFPANVPAFAITAAMLAGLGIAVGGMGGGGGSGADSLGNPNTGTGTVLGDPTAQSESIAKSLDELSGIDTETARYSAQMAASLRNIESNIGGVASLLIKSGAIDASAAGIQTGFKQDALGKLAALPNKLVAATVAKIPVIGGIAAGLLNKVGNIVGNLFGTKTSITGQGIFAGAQSLSSVLSGGFQAQYFTEIEKKKKAFGVTYSSSKSVRMTDADAQFEDQITKVFSNFSTLVKAAAGPLGRNLGDIQAKLDSFVVNIGRIDTKGLSGQELQDRLTAVFGAVGDNIAAVALGGLEQFQKVGEGYLQTVTRVATGVEVGTLALKKLRIAAIDYNKVANKQGDVSAELVRDSIIAADGLNLLTEVIATLDGSGSDIADAFRALDDVRTSMKLLGLDASAVGFDLINGAGGAQALADAVKAFEEGFTDEGAQVTNKAKRLSDQFEKLGLSMPSSSADFVKLVKGIDTSTESGRDLLGAVLALSGGFSDLLGALKDTGKGIADEIERIKGLSATGSARTLAGAQADFSIATVQARAGSQTAVDSLPKLSQALLDVAQSSASSAEEYATIQAQTLASLQATLDAITDPKKRLTVPGFASGGSFGGGLRLVGENGPELEVTGPSRIFNADQTRALLSRGDESLAAEVRALREEVAALRAEQMQGHAAIAGHARRTAETLTRVTPDGYALAVKTAT